MDPTTEVTFRRLCDLGECHGDPAKARAALWPDRPDMRNGQMARHLTALLMDGYAEARGAKVFPALAPDAWRGKRRATHRRTEEVPIPPALDTGDFRAEWATYLEYRRNQRRFAMRPTEAEAALATLVTIGPTAAVDCLRRSRMKNLRGIQLPFKPAVTDGSRQLQPKQGDPRRITGQTSDEHRPTII